MVWTDIEAKLQERAEDVCRNLLPNGHREGGEWVVGSLAGEVGASLKINLTDKPGVWCDFAEGGNSGKSLLNLWMKVRNLPSFGAAMGEAKKFLGIHDDYQTRFMQPPGAKSVTDLPDESTWKLLAETWSKCVPLTEGGPVWKFLVEQRKLDPAMLDALDVREFNAHGQWAIVFAYYAASAKDKPAVATGQPLPAWLKFELLDRPGGKKKEWTTKQPEKSLFGVQLAEHPLFAKCQHVLLCEGEKDVVAWATYGCQEWGILPVSVPFGAKWKGQDKHRPSPNREWLDWDWDWLQAYETVFVCMDADEAGQRAAADIIAEIGPRRCRLLTLPDGKKDRNDCLMAGVPRATIRAALDTAKDFSPEQIISAVGLEVKFLEWVFNREPESGIPMPFDMPLRLRRNEMTLWMGIKGCGKSTALDHVTVQAMYMGERVLVASFEMPWQDTNDKLCRQAFGGQYFDHRILKQCTTDAEQAAYLELARQQTAATHRWLAKNLWYYDHVGIGKWRQLMDDICWARRRLGITFVQIDNFMRLGILAKDYEQQAEAMIAFASLAMELGIHIVMVIHQTKKEGRDSREEGFGDVHSASGAHQIADNCHNIVEIQRNDKKGKQMSELFDQLKLKTLSQQEFNAQKSALDLKPDGKFVLHAQRNGVVQDGSKNLWFLRDSQQYVGVPPGHRDFLARRFVQETVAAPKVDEMNEVI